MPRALFTHGLLRVPHRWLARLRARRAPERAPVVALVALPELGSWSTWVPSAGVELQCRAGELWITQEGDLEDHLLSAPDRFVTSRRGRLGVTGLTEARFTLARPTSALPSRPVTPRGRPGPDADQAA